MAREVRERFTTTLDTRPSDGTLVYLMVEPENQPSKTTVLVVFRQRSVANWIGECLREVGYVVAVAEGYDDALRALHFIEPDAAIVNASKVEGDVEQFLTWFQSHMHAGSVPTVLVAPTRSQAALAHFGARKRSRMAYLSWPLKCRDLQHIMLDLLHTGRRRMGPVSDRRLVLDPRLRILRGRAGATILTPAECCLAEYLMSRAAKIIAVEEVLTHVFGLYPGNGNPSFVWAHLRSLRRKIRIVTGGTDLIRTVGKRGFTYLGRGGTV
jgi:DNA-binding response OmpR family regulator